MQLNDSKSFYVPLTIQLNIHLSFLYTQLNGQTFLFQKIQFQTIQFNIICLFALSLNVKQFYLTHR